jgi:hypothetical protein
MVESIYVQAFKKEMNKDKVKGDLPSFSMLVMKCNDATPCLSIVLRMENNDEHLVLKVTLVLHVAIFPFRPSNPPPCLACC